MANLQRFTLVESWADWKITVEIDRDLLTEQMATAINTFWTGAEDRLDESDGDVVKAVVKMAAERWIYLLLEVGGGHIREQAAQRWTEQLHEGEGWGGVVDGSPFGACGIRLVWADVEIGLDLDFVGV